MASSSASFDELLSRLAPSPDLPNTRVNAMSDVVNHNVHAPDTFVAPEIVRTDASADGKAPSVLLVTASAAVGKSLLAASLAERSGNPLWTLNAARTRLGSNFFSGTLTRTYDDADYVSVRRMLRDGDVTLLVDAVDEALVQVGVDIFEEAMADLALIAGETSGVRPAFVLFGRPESLDFAALALDERGVSWEKLRIEYFGSANRIEFVEIVARSLLGSSADLSSVRRFAVRAFEEIGSSVELGDPSLADGQDLQALDSFLGYAPVLDAIARLAADPGSKNMAANLEANRDDASVWNTLCRVFDWILDRELDKVKLMDEERSSIYPLVFSPDAQLSLCLSLDPENDLERPAECSAKDWEIVRAKVLAQLRDHAFLREGAHKLPSRLSRFRNPAFRDYALAALMRLETDADDSLSVNAVLALLEEGISPAPLFVRLLLSKAAGQTLSLSSLPYMLDSAATTLRGRTLNTAIDRSKDGLAGEARLHVTVTEEGRDFLACVMVGKAEEVRLGQQLAHAQLYLSGLGVTADFPGEFALGPDVLLVCDELLWKSASVRVLSNEDGDSSGPVILKVNATAGASGGVHDSFKILRVEAPSGTLRYPWASYYRQQSGGRYPTETVYQQFIQLRRLMQWFLRKSRDGDLTYPKSAFDIIVRKGRAPESWFRFLIQAGYLSVRRNFFYEANLPFEATLLTSGQADDPRVRELIEVYLAAQEQERTS